MNSLDRAKRFLAAKTAKLAMVAVPLAMAVPAAFGQISFSTAAGCTVTAGVGTCGVEQLSSTGGNPLANWVDIFTNQAVTPSNGSISFLTSGSATGIVNSGEIFPVSWDFSLSQQQTQLPGNQSGLTTVAPFDVSLNWFLNTDSGTFSFTQDLGNLSIGTYIGSATFAPNLASGSTASLSSYEIQMSITNDTNFIQVSVPQGTSIDLNSSTATPEPGTFALLGGTGMLGLLWRFRRRKV
jgi:hypothetical protein